MSELHEGSLLTALPQALSWQEAALEVLRDWCGDIHERRVHQTWGDRVVIEARTSCFPTGVVLKASADKSVRAEAYAARCAERAGVPVAAILAEGKDQRLPGQDWFVMRRADGQPWASVAQADMQRARTLDDIGHAFASLHGITVQVRTAHARLRRAVPLVVGLASC
jgi:aminoglycoside phosphotransferase